MIFDCDYCNGSGYVIATDIGVDDPKSVKIPCVNCNTRGKVSDKLYNDELSKMPGK